MLLSSLRKLIEKETGETNFSLSQPEAKAHGHLSTNAAFLISKEKKISPIEAARNLKSELFKKAPDNFFQKIEIAGPGFLNFWISEEEIQKSFKMVAKAGSKWGKPAQKTGETVIVEYSAPNIAKPMHVGHLRSTIIGDALANVYSFLGYRVIRWNYIGDWGTQFGKLIAAYKKWGNKGEVEQAPIETLLKLYVRFHEELKNSPSLEKEGQEEFKKLEAGDRENKKLWNWFRKESLKEFSKIYQRLGVKFDLIIGESFYEKDLKPLIRRFKEKSIAKESEGAFIVPLDKFGLPPALIRKSDEASLYLTRDIANLEYRLKKYKPAKILYVVANEQALHFSQLFAIAKITGLNSTELYHIKFGLVLGEEGKKFSTREGRTVQLEELLTKSIELAKKVVDEKNPSLPERERRKVAETVGVGALKYNDLSQNRMSDVTFNWGRILSLQGNSAPYLQYSYSRLTSILNKAGRYKLKTDNIGLLGSSLETALILKLVQFPEIIKLTAETNSPNHLTDYLYNLAQRANTFYEKEPVLKAESGLREARLELIKTVASILKTGLNLLGIKTLERM